MFVLLVLLGAVDGGTPLRVPPTGSDFNGFQVLGLTQSHVAVRELRAIDTDPEEEVCNYPVSALVENRDGTERPEDPRGAGVTLWSWRLPPVGIAAVADGAHFEIYTSARTGCTREAQAAATLSRAKESFADAGVPLDEKLERVAFTPERFGDTFFQPSCFSTPRGRKGCTTTLRGQLAGKPVTLSVNQLAKSDCVTKPGETATIGCATSSRWRGHVELDGQKTPFDLFTDEMAGNSAYRLDSAVIWQTREATVAALYFNWCYAGCRSRLPVLLRLR